MGRVGAIQDRFVPLDVGFESSQFVQKTGLRPGTDLVGNRCDELVGEAQRVERWVQVIGNGGQRTVLIQE